MNMLPSDYACPRCKCRACYALHRKGMDWVVSLVGLRPARCLTCTRRFYARYKMTEDGKYVLGAPKHAVGFLESESAVDGEQPGKAFDTAA
jgi:hypothetical protein